MHTLMEQCSTYTAAVLGTQTLKLSVCRDITKKMWHNIWNVHVDLSTALFFSEDPLNNWNSLCSISLCSTCDTNSHKQTENDPASAPYSTIYCYFIALHYSLMFMHTFQMIAVIYVASCYSYWYAWYIYIIIDVLGYMWQMFRQFTHI